MSASTLADIRDDLAPWQPCEASGWKRMQAKRAFEIVLGKMLQPTADRPDAEEVPYLKALHVQWSRVELDELPTMWAAPWEIKQLSLAIGDLLVCEGGEVGRAARLTVQPPEKCIIQNALHRVRRGELGHVGFLSYCLRQAADKRWFDVLCNRATIAHFTVEKFRDLWLHLPPVEVQQRIADYLDGETAQIDALVAEKERMLALLEEKRVALVSRTVTLGLNQNVPMKPSGLDWLGDIPAHWDVRRLKNVAQELQTGPFGSQLHAEEYTDAGIPVINPADIAGFQINGNKAAKIDRDTAERLSRHRMVPGDVIFARRGELDRSAVVGPEQDGWLCGTGCLRVRLNQDLLDPEFLLFVMADTNAGNFLGAESVGSTMENLNTETLGRLFIPFPPLIEQRAIVQHLQNEQQHLENLKGVLAASISLLKERRSALITAAVTGQLALEAMSA